MGANIYEIVTERIIEKIENGVVPWKIPWVDRKAVNWVTQKPYRGINTLLLDPGEYASFKQIKDAGGSVKPGEKAQMCVFFKWVEKEKDGEDEEKGTERVPYLRYYNVFNIATQVDGLKSKVKDEESFENNPIEEAESIFNGYKNKPKVTFGSGRAYYMPSEDRINIPPTNDFKNIEQYYSTLFHEMVHSTGAKHRLNRDGIVKKAAFGDEVYGKEELVAEIGANMLCGIARIVNDTIDNSAAYVKAWLKALKDDKTLIVRASQQAQKASDHILGKVYSEQ